MAEWELSFVLFFFFFLILNTGLRISFSWKSNEKMFKNPWTLFHGHENSNLGFHVAKLYKLWNFHEILYQLVSWTMKSLQSREYNWFSWVTKVSYILDRYISWPLKRQLQPSMYFMGDESSNGPWNYHEGTIKNPWKCPTHTSTKVDINALEKCCTHLLIRE